MPAALVVTDPADSGPNTLRGIIATANANAEADTITFDAGITTISLTGGQIDITEASQGLVIDGGGKVTIVNTAASSATSRVFTITATGKPAIGLTGLTMSGGNLAAGNNGGAILFTDQVLTLTNCTLSGNTAIGAASNGGAIATITASASLTLTNCTLSTNFAGAAGGAIHTGGASTAVTINGSSFSDNRSTTVGGAVNFGGATTTVNIGSSTFSTNTATTTGGAINSAGAATTVTVNDSTLTKNSSTTTGGAINSATTTFTLNLTNSTLSFNTATSTGGALNIASSATVTINSSSMTGNSSGNNGGAVSAVSVKFDAFDSSFTNNTGASGGALRFTIVSTTSVTLTRCIMSGNTAKAAGGAFYGSTSGSFNIVDSSLINNTAATGGGAIRVANATMNITNSTISGNVSNGTTGTTGGGGILFTAAPTANIRNSTIANNTANGGSAVGGGIFVNATTGTITLNSTIVAGNFNPINRDFGASGARAIAGTNNLFGALDNVTYTIGAPNQFGSEGTPTSARLYQLGNFGGPTLTHAPLFDSPALNMGNNVATALTNDQRGSPREVPLGQPDVGSVEGSPLTPFAEEVTGLTDVLSGGGTSYAFTVTFNDETGINTSKLGTGEIVVMAPGGGVALPVTFGGFTLGTGKQILASYTLTPPGGSWDAIDSGLYTVHLVAGKLFDTDSTPLSSIQADVAAFNVSFGGALVVDNSSDVDDGNTVPGQVSIREAIRVSNYTVGAADTITFAGSLSGATITLNSGQMFVTDPVQIDGPGMTKLTLSGVPQASAINRIFNVDLPGVGGVFDLSGMTLANSNVVTGGNGGAIVMRDDRLNIDDMLFLNNKNLGAGGAMVLGAAAGGDSLHATNSKFIGNSVSAPGTNTGGAIVTAGAGISLFFDNCHFEANSTGGNGGALGLTGGTNTVTISNSTFLKNTVGGFGAAISTATNGHQLIITNTTFEMNTAVGRGGAIGTSNNSTVTITGSSFSENTSGVEGGAIQGGSTITLIITGSSFAKNTAVQNGGALNIGAGTTSISFSTFTNNNAGALGGAMHFPSAAVYTIDDSTLSNNTAGTNGGAIHASSATGVVNLNRSTLSGNIASDAGGGLSTLGGPSITIIDSTVSGNVASGAATGGGGLSLTIAAATGITITNSTISGNTASGATAIGGGIRANATAVGATLTINNTTITRNSATGNGGGIGLVTNTATLTIQSTILAQNFNATDPDLFSTETMPLTFVNITDSIIGAVTDTDLDVTSGSGNQTGKLATPIDAKLTPLGKYGGTTQTHGLFKGSPALDNGGNPLALANDQRGPGFPRPIDPADTDVGSFEGELNIPTATVVALPNITVPGGATYVVQVIYFDVAANIKTSTIDNSDITVTGPGGPLTPAIPASFTGAGGSVTATYTFTTPGGAWDNTDDGLYTVTMNDSQVSNDAGLPLFVLPSNLGTFSVVIPTSYVVDNVADVDDGNYGVGQLTLREAIKLANTVSQLATDTITFDAALNGKTIALVDGELAVTDPVVITGPGPGLLTLSGAVVAAADNRIFNVNISGAQQFTLSGLTLTGGNLSSGNGGAISSSGAIFTATNVHFVGNKTTGAGGAVSLAGATPLFDGCTFENNSAGGTGGAVNILAGGSTVAFKNCTLTGNASTGSGGGIAMAANTAITVDNSLFMKNTAGSEGGAINASSPTTLTINGSTFKENSSTSATTTAGGGALNLGNSGSTTTTFSNSTFTANKATSGIGGAVKLPSGGNFVFNDCVISDNQAALTGGGISAGNANDTLTLNRTTVSGNTAAAGAGVYVAGGTLSVIDSTINNNLASGAVGGGGIGITTGTLNVTNSTLSGNTAAGGGGGIGVGGAANLSVHNSTLTRNAANGAGGGGIAFAASPASVTINSTIIAQNIHPTDPDLFTLGTGTATAFVFGTRNFIGLNVDTDLTLDFDNQVGVVAPGINAKLGVLSNNGGPTLTHGLAVGSPALNAGNNVLALANDQRGVARPVDPAQTDIGAVEGLSAIPIASATPADIVTAGGTSVVISVNYTDDVGINLGSIGLTDITISTPYGKTLAPTSLNVIGSGQSVTVEYTFQAVGGTWDQFDNGTYAVNVVAGEVLDSDGTPHSVPAGVIANFKVAIPGPVAFVVDNAVDESDNDFSPGDLSLREAVLLANNTSGGVDTITFAAALTGQTLNLTLGEIAITDAIAIVGPGAAKLTIAGAAIPSTTNRIFNINIGAGTQTVDLSGLTLTGGNVVGNGGAITRTDETLTATNVVFSKNVASGNGGALQASVAGGEFVLIGCTFDSNSGVLGGAVAFVGGTNTLTVTNSTFTNNIATNQGGAVQGNSTITINITGSSFIGNTATNGGGALNIGVGTATITSTTFANNAATTTGAGAVNMPSAGTVATFDNCTFTGNSTVVNGGAINSTGANQMITLNRSTLANNTAGGTGGGIDVAGASTLTVNSSTLSGNGAAGANTGGGGINFSSTGTLNITNSTLSGNLATGSAAIGGGIRIGGFAVLSFNNNTLTQNSASLGGGGIGFNATPTAPTTINSTIIAQNIGGADPDVFSNGAVPVPVTGTKNLVGLLVDVDITFDFDNQIGLVGPGIDAKLGALANNGGPTQTHALLPGSPAIDAGNNTLALTEDQRGTGFVREFAGGFPDIGAFELQPVAVTKVTKVEVNNGAAQRSRVTTVRVTFDSIITIAGSAEAAFQLKRQSDGKLPTLVASVDNTGPGTVVTLTFTGSNAVDFGSLADGRYTLTAFASQISGLDGDGNGTAGDDYTLVGDPNVSPKLYRLFGDSDGDNDVDTSDFAQFRLVYGGGASIFDFDNDGDTDTTDFGAFRARFGASV